MIRNIIAAIAVILAVWATIYMIGLDKEANKLQRISELIKSTQMEDKKITSQQQTQQTQQVQVVESSSSEAKKKQDDEVAKKLQALREKAGNLAAFKTSPLYKKSCASCHGNIGEGIIGPKLIGDSKDKILTALKDFKSGKRKNYVMYGLLSNMSDEQLEQLADEISKFQEKLDEASK
jgi:cytochrome c553